MVKLGSKPVGILIGIMLFALLWYMELIPFLRPSGPPAEGAAPSQAAIFGKQFAALPPWVQIWMKFQDIIIASSLLFVMFRKEAQIYALGVLANHAFLFPVMSMVPIDKLTLGFAALSHFFWIIPLIVLVRAWPKTDKNTAFGIWMTVAIFQLIFSLSFDIPDGLQFLFSLLS